MVQTPNDDAGSRGDRFLQIDAVIPVTLFFGYDKRIGQPPAWLRKQLKSGWQIAAGKTIQTNDTEFRLYQKQFPAGRISLGGNTDDGKDGGKSNYLVVLLPAGLPPRAKPTRIADVLPRLTTASARRGKALFFAEGGAGCAKCHRSDTGTAAGFGPDLQHLVKEADPRRVVESILEPSAQIKEGFTLQIVIRADGRKQSGILHSETKTALTLLQPDGKRIVVPRDQIEERIGQRISPMPSFEKLLSPQQVADITHWLVTRRRPRP